MIDQVFQQLVQARNLKGFGKFYLHNMHESSCIERLRKGCI